MDSLVSAFLAHARALRQNAPPTQALSAAKTFTLDTLAVGIAGENAPYAASVRDAIMADGAQGTAPVFGSARKTISAPAAAFINGFHIHCQEYDCVHEGAVVHPMATIFAALSADICGRGMSVSGQDYLRAVILAVDVAATLGLASTSALRFFRPANAGIFGATMGLSFLRGFTDEQTKDALGYALAFNAGTMQAHVEGKPALPIQIGNAARNAIVACDLAERNVPGPHDVFQGPYGYLSLFETSFRLDGLIENLGTHWRITEVSHKPFPTGRAAQGGIVLAQRFWSQRLPLGAIAKITLHAPPLISQLVGRPVQDGMTPNYSRLCFAYLCAVVLRRGTVSLGDFSDACLSDPETLKLAQKVSVKINTISDPAAFTPQRLEVATIDGAMHHETIDDLYGSPAAPMSRSAQIEKVQACLRATYDESHAQTLAPELIASCDRLETMKDVRNLFMLARAEGNDVRTSQHVL